MLRNGAIQQLQPELRQFLSNYIFSGQKRWRLQTCDKPQVPKRFHSYLLKIFLTKTIF